MVRNVKVLQSHGLIVPADGHGKTFRVSPAGETILKSAFPLWEAVQKEMETLLGPEDAAAILRIGSKLQDFRQAGFTCQSPVRPAP